MAGKGERGASGERVREGSAGVGGAGGGGGHESGGDDEAPDGFGKIAATGQGGTPTCSCVCDAGVTAEQAIEAR